MLVPVVAVILALALYPQLALHRSEGSVKTAVAPRPQPRWPACTATIRQQVDP